MPEQSCIVLLTYFALAIPVSVGFNIDVTVPKIYDGEQKHFFGYKVLQFMSGTSKGIVVTAPLNGSGAICKYDSSQTINCFNPQEFSLKDQTFPVKHFGLSIAEDPKGSGFTVCSPSVVQECQENSYLNGVCFNLTDNLQLISFFTPAFQECRNKTVDLVFLFDGSRSMKEEEFKKNKDFIKEIMEELKGTSIKFAAVQFSTDYRTVFDFRDYEAGNALANLTEEKHMKGLTNTYRALAFVLSGIFENPNTGASPDATKVVVLITDGDPSEESTDITDVYNSKHIIRFVIGVKDAKLEKFQAIASEPKNKNAFKIKNYDGLKGVLGDLQKKIFKMEGSTTARTDDMKEEMSQSGFSAVFQKDTLILGSVGSNGWRGSLQKLQGEKKTQIEDPNMKMDSYMGYSISVGQKTGVSLYFTGAPRYEHKGQVLIFRQLRVKWAVAQRIHGVQIGSYFGAELCSLDVDEDGDTDFLLVGAPLFYQHQEKTEGQIHVYSLTNERQLEFKMNLTASMGRFGTSISTLGDLNGDGLQDVAVGAPLEDDNRGAVYIFLGDRWSGISSHFSQRIMGKNIDPGLRLFGQAIDGGIDLGEDGLPDVVVGSQGSAVVLRSRPIFNLTAHLSFQPREISTDKIDCLAINQENLPMVDVAVCFEMVETTKSKAGADDSGLNISYVLKVDPMRQTNRGFFGQTDKKARDLSSTYELLDRMTCFNYSIHMPSCVLDTLSPIHIELTFSQEVSESGDAILNVDSKRQASMEVPFEKQCMKNDTCVAELEVDFNFSTPILLVAEDTYLNLSVKLSNHGDDSYNTSLSMHYPPGLSLSRMTLTEATRPTLHLCHDLPGVLDRTECGVSLPVYRSQSSATFQTSFLILTGYNWNETVSITIAGLSDNTNSSSSPTKTIPVQLQVKMAVTVREDTVTYLNFTTEDTAPKEVLIIYKIENPGWKAFPVNVSLFFPTQLAHDFEMKRYQVSDQQNLTRCTGVTDMKSEYCSPEKYCKRVDCDTFMLKKESTVEFILSGDVHFRDLKKNAANIDFLQRFTGDGAEVTFKSFIHVSYDKQRYVLDSHKEEERSANFERRRGNDPTFKSAEVRVELIMLPDQLLIISTGAGVGILLLLLITIIMFKLGCFRSKTLEYYQEQEDEAAQQAGTPTELTPALANGTGGQSEAQSKPEQSPEDKSLEDEDEASSKVLPIDEEVEQD